MPHVIISHFRVFTFYRSVASKVRLSACLALFPQEGALWMSTGSSRWPETGGRCFTPFQWEILFSKKRPTSRQQVGEGERETSVAHHWRFQPQVERRPEKKKKRGQRSNVHCGGNGALFWLTRESSRQETDRIQTNPERKRRREKKKPRTTNGLIVAAGGKDSASQKSLRLTSSSTWPRAPAVPVPVPAPAAACPWRATRRWTSPPCELWWVNEPGHPETRGASCRRWTV